MSFRFAFAVTSCACLLTFGMADSAHAALYQNLTAADPASITQDASGVVSAWTDQTGNGNHASASTGSVTYPSTHLYPTGKVGVQFGPPSKSLQLLSGANTAELLDFNGPASTHSGFSVLVSVRVDELNPTGEPNDLIGVTSVNNAGGFGLRCACPSRTGGRGKEVGPQRLRRPHFAGLDRGLGIVVTLPPPGKRRVGSRMFRVGM